MNLLFYKDLIIKYISQTVKPEEQKLIKKVLENDESIFFYSKKFFQFIKEELGDKNQDLYQALFKRLSDFGSKVESSNVSSNFDEEFLHIYQSFTRSVLVSVSYIKPTDTITKAIPNIVILSDSKKPNYHWLAIQLAIQHPNKVSVDCFDFNDDDEIKRFFYDAYRLPKSISRMHIFDRQTIQFAHKNFDSFKKKISVFYYTYQHKDFSLDEPVLRREFANKIKILITRNKNSLHSRKLVFEGFVLTSNHDFNELLIGGDWEIDLLFSQSEATKWIARCSNFREYKQS